MLFDQTKTQITRYENSSFYYVEVCTHMLLDRNIKGEQLNVTTYNMYFLIFQEINTGIRIVKSYSFVL